VLESDFGVILRKKKTIKDFIMRKERVWEGERFNKNFQKGKRKRLKIHNE